MAVKFSELASATSLASSDIHVVVTGMNGTPVSKKISDKNYLGALSSNAVFNANVTFRGNKVHAAANSINTKTTTVNNFITTLKTNPATNNATTEGYASASLFFSNTHLYLAVNATTLKRVALSTF